MSFPWTPLTPARQHGGRAPNFPLPPKRLSLLIALALAGTTLPALPPQAQAAPPVVSAPARNALPNPYANGSGVGRFAAHGNVRWEIDPAIANTMNITQSSLRAIGRFHSFDIGQDARVNVRNEVGSNGQFLAAIDANGTPSRIFGRLESNASVYLLNQNGVVFGPNSQVNVRSLIASALDIGEAKFLNGFDEGANDPNATEPLKVFEWNVANAASNNIDFDQTYVQVLPGARITTASGGQVLLLAPHVVNGGDIRTPQGQTILAGGAKVYLQFSEDPALRGMLVEVDPLEIQQPDGTRTTAHGSATNDVPGRITADEGNITLVAYTVKQHGTLTATTSVRQNGSIYLKAQDGAAAPIFAPAKAATDESPASPAHWELRGAVNPGPLEIGNGATTSTTAVDPVISTDTSQDGQSFQKSTIKLSGGQIVFNSNSLVRAAGGELTVSTETDQSLGISLDDTLASLNRWIEIRPGATIDVSGSQQVGVSVSRNFVQTTPYGSELKDVPPQRNGFLYRQPLWIDLRRLPKVADFSAYLSQIERTVSERTAGGGSIGITTRGQVVQHAGSTLDVSGGSILYQGGLGRTTQLVSGNKVYDIGDAPANLNYNGFARVFTLKLDKWNYTKTWGGSGGDKKLTAVERYYPGYLEGKDAGSINIVASGVALEGELKGHTTPGPNQRTAATLPKGGQFVLGNANSSVGRYWTPDVTFSNDIVPVAEGIMPGTPLPAVTLATRHFSEGGFGQVTVASDGTVTLPEDVALSVQPGGSVTFKGRQVSVDGRITAPGGTISLSTTANTSRFHNGVVPAYLLRIGESAMLSTRGLWTNDLIGGAGNPFAPVFTKGGEVTLASYADLNLAAGSVVDVSGGGWVNGGGKLQGGTGGTITLKTGDNGVDETQQRGSQITLDGELRGYGLAGGGSLTLDVGQARIGGAPPGAGDPRALLHLEESFFQRGGFAKYTVKSRDGLRVVAGAVVRPLTEILQVDSDFHRRASGADLYDFTRRELPILAERAPVELNLSAGYITADDRIIGNIEFGKLVVEAGASIATDIGGKINLSAARQIIVDGTLEAPAGSISLSLNGVNSQQSYFEDQYIWLGQDSQLLARGAVQTRLDAAGFNTGEVLAGGQISVTAKQGYIVTQEGSSMDVSGSSGSVDIVTQGGARTANVETRQIASDAGGISLTAAEGMLLYGNWRAFAGGATARGGSLNVEMTTPVRNNPTTFPTGPRRIVVSNEFSIPFPAGLTAGGPIELLAVANDPATSVYNGRAFVALDKVRTGGFDSLSLRASDRIEFTGSTSLAMRQRLLLDAPVIEVRQDSHAAQRTLVELRAPYLLFGNTPNALSNEVHVGGASASTGSGEIELHGQLIDLVGDTALQGVGEFRAFSDGDIRLRATSQYVDRINNKYEGRLSTAGNITLQADQVYPTTLSDFTLLVTDNPAGRVTILPGDGGSPVLSAGGRLVIDAPIIDQQGVLKAPFGEIDFMAASSLHLSSESRTSVSGEGQLVPFGYTEVGGSNLFYDFGTDGSERRQFGEADGQFAPPQKAVRIRTPDFVMDPGAQVDVSGGGDLYTYEFTPGPPGRSIDILDPVARDRAKSDPSAVIRASAAEYEGTYAIMPGLGSAFAAYDQQAFLAAGAPMPGSSVYLSGVPGLAAGVYALLPARYALLPGAFLVKQLTGYQDMTSRQRIAQPDGSVLTSGYFTTVTDPGTTIRDARTSGFMVRSGASIKYDVDYGTRTLSDWIARSGAAWQAPADAGRFVINATQQLALNGRFLGTPGNGGQGSQVDILGTNIIIADAAASDDNLPPDTIQIAASTLTDLGAASLLIGGERSNTASGVQVDVGATTVTVANNSDSELVAPEIMLVATNNVTLRPNSVVRARGNARLSQAPLTLTSSDPLIPGQSALLRVASGAQVGVLRAFDKNTNGSDKTTIGDTRGTLTIDLGASVIAESNATGQSSAIFDATHDMTNAGTLRIGSTTAPGDLAIGARRISLGTLPTPLPDGAPLNPGLVLTNLQIANLGDLNTLNLRSYSSIDVYGGVQLSAGTSLGLETAQIRGLGNAGMQSVIRAGQDLRISNPNGFTDSNVATAATGSQLTLGAGRDLILGRTSASTAPNAGKMDIGGFQNVTLSAGRDLAVDGKGSLTVAADLALNARRITGRTGADFEINAQGPSDVWHSVVTGAPATPWQGELPALTDIAARLKIIGGSVTHGGTIDLPSGVLQLEARAAGGDIEILDGASIVAQGVVKQFDTQYAYAPGGAVILSSAQGDVILENGASIDVSGAEGGNAGSITVQAANGEFNLKGELLGRARARTGQTTAPAGGSFILDAGSIANFTDTTGTIAGFTHLNRTLEANGFNTQRHVRVRTGDLALGAAETITARDVRLVADGGGVNDGNIDIAGRIDARGPRGGHVGLWAARALNIRSNPLTVIDASANGPGDQRGGSVLLATRDSLATGVGINVESGATINVAGTGALADSGSVHVRAPRKASGGVGTPDNEVAITALRGTITGARQIVVEAYQPYTPAAGETLSSAIAGQLTSATTFMNASAAAIVQRLQEQLVLGGNTAALHLRPGIEIVSDGSLQLDTALNLFSSAAIPNAQTVRYGTSSEPGILTLRAAGNLTLNASLSDGFSTATSAGTLQAGDSWSYRLVAGADRGSADANAVLLPTTPASGSGNFTMADNTLVRTGTGNIDIAAGGKVNLGIGAVIYTAGQPDAVPLANFIAPTSAFLPNYPLGGGDLSIQAQRDIVSAQPTNTVNTVAVPYQQVVTDWLWRQGNFATTNQRYLTWYPRFDLFKQGVAAFGGGDVRVAAGGNIDNFSVALPTSGRLPDVVSHDNTVPITPDQANLRVLGGGDMSVIAGGDIRSGVYYLGAGTGKIQAWGSLVSNIEVSRPAGTTEAIRLQPLYPILALADGQLAVSAGGELSVQTIINPTTFPVVPRNISRNPGNPITAPANVITDLISNFYTYGADSAVSLTAVGGSVHLVNKTEAIVASSSRFNTVGSYGPSGFLFNVYPPTLRAASLAGDVHVNNPFTLYPGPRGQLELLAGGSVLIANGVINAPDIWPDSASALATLLKPKTGTDSNDSIGDAIGQALGVGSIGFTAHAIDARGKLLHADDPEPIRIVALTGDVSGISEDENGIDARESGLGTFPKPVVLQAGLDLIDVGFYGQNLHDSDITRLQAGRDLRFTILTDTDGGPKANSSGVFIGGPGRVEVIAGRNVDLGTSKGILTQGNINNPNLPEGGAALMVLAGAAPAIANYPAFSNYYLSGGCVDGQASYVCDLQSAMRARTGNPGLSDTDALAQFNSLRPEQQTAFVNHVLFSELRRAGRDATDKESGAFGTYQRGYDAIARLFPANGAGPEPGGSINLYFSQLKTEQGGDIELLAPYGAVVAGLPTVPAGFDKKAAELGIVTVQGGAIRAMTGNDFLVNSQRVFTLQGGDIMLWSSEGDVDAGRGAKTASAAPPPRQRRKSDGTVELDLTQSISGSGIAALRANPDVTPGNVDLIAPRGTVNAGEAGIRALGDINIAALQVAGADNIQVGGRAAGLPVADTSGLGAAAASSAAAGTGKTSDDILKNTDALADGQLANVEVDVLGYGENPLQK